MFLLTGYALIFIISMWVVLKALENENQRLIEDKNLTEEEYFVIRKLNIPNIEVMQYILHKLYKKGVISKEGNKLAFIGDMGELTKYERIVANYFKEAQSFDSVIEKIKKFNRLTELDILRGFVQDIRKNIYEEITFIKNGENKLDKYIKIKDFLIFMGPIFPIAIFLILIVGEKYIGNNIVFQYIYMDFMLLLRSPKLSMIAIFLWGYMYRRGTSKINDNRFERVQFKYWCDNFREKLLKDEYLIDKKSLTKELNVSTFEAAVEGEHYSVLLDRAEEASGTKYAPNDRNSRGVVSKEVCDKSDKEHWLYDLLTDEYDDYFF